MGGGNLNDVLKVCHGISADNGESCICNRVLSTRKFLYDVGIIVPVYNAEQYISECISSILQQRTKFSFHIIIVNDGSTDGSREKLKQFENNESVTIIDQENKGHSGARNTGLDNCFGRYIMFVDADDRLPLNAIEALVDEAVKGDYDIVGGGYSRFDGERMLLKTLPRHSQLFGFPWGKVYKATIWDNVQFPQNYWFEDTVCAFVIHDRASRISALEEIVYEWRRNTRSVSFFSAGKPKILDTLYIRDQILKDRIQLNLPLDESFCDVLLHQFKVNAMRIYTLGDSSANFANYVFSREIFNRFVRPLDFHSKQYDNIEESLADDHYRQFILSCLLVLMLVSTLRQMILFN